MLCCLAALYVLIAAAALPSRLYRAIRPGPPGRRHGAAAPAVSVLKPLCGAEPNLYENLATFCEQTHPCFQLLFGVSSDADPAIDVVRRLQDAYPSHDIGLVVDATRHGSNLKVGNLINLARHARHSIIVVADSDIAVAPAYLETVTAPLADPDVGIVTCLYRARGVAGFWSRVGAMFINEWFAPSVCVAHAGGSRRFGFGATLALRRATLEHIGGFEVLKDCLADDYWLAEHTRRLGLRTVLSPMAVITDVTETRLGALWQRELRWLRTIRAVNPPGFAFLFITFATPWLMLSALLAHHFNTDDALSRSLVDAMSDASMYVGIGARLWLHARAAPDGRTFWRELPLVPLRDVLLLLEWLAAWFGSYVMWRGARVPVDRSPSRARQRASVPEAADGV